MCALFGPAQSQPIIDRFVLKWQIYNNNKWHTMFLSVFLQKVAKEANNSNNTKKGINEYENKIIRFYYYQAYFSVLFNTSYYIIIITPLHSVRFECISFAFLCLLHLVYKKQQPKMSLYIIINFTSLPSLFYCYIFSYIFLQSTQFSPTHERHTKQSVQFS